jgi:hypothetical protein
MTDAAVLTVSEFLLARIAEDEGTRAVPGGGRWAVVTDQEVAEAERWRAECEAKRRIVREHDAAGCDYCPEVVDDCPTLRALAAVYRDHPDYREEWQRL